MDDESVVASGGDLPSKPRRWRWAPLTVIAALAVLVLLLSVAFIRDEIAKPIDRGLTDESTLGWPTTAPTASPSPLPSPTATDCPGERLADTPEAAAADLLNAWTGKIQPMRACAARVATPSVVHYVTSAGASPDAAWPGAFAGCDQLSTIAGIFHCQWRQAGGSQVTLQMRVEAVAGGYVVTALRIPGPAPTRTASSSPPSGLPSTNPSPTESISPGR